MQIENFIQKIQQNYKKDIKKNIKYENENIILLNNDNFNFDRIFIVDFMESGLYKKYNFTAIGTSEDNNIYIDSEYYDYLKQYYARRDYENNAIILSTK